MATYHSISGMITYLNTNGCGLIKPSHPIGAHSGNIFFTIESLPEGINWTDLTLNQKVLMPQVISRNGNLIAPNVFR